MDVTEQPAPEKDIARVVTANLDQVLALVGAGCPVMRKTNLPQTLSGCPLSSAREGDQLPQPCVFV